MWSDEPLPELEFLRGGVLKRVKDVSVEDLMLDCSSRDCDVVALRHNGDPSRFLFIQTKPMRVQFFEEHLQIFPDETLASLYDQMNNKLAKACCFRPISTAPVLSLEGFRSWWRGQPPEQHPGLPSSATMLTGRLILASSKLTRDSPALPYHVDLWAYQFHQSG